MKHSRLIFFIIPCLLMSASVCSLRAQQTQESDPAASMQRLMMRDAARVHLMGGDQAWLGVELADVTPAKVKELKLPGEYGAIVTQVVENSPAAKAGLKVDDVILEFGGMKVWSATQLKRLVDETPSGRNVSLRVSRSGQRLALQVTTGSPTSHEFKFSPSITIPNINFPKGFFYQLAPFGMRGRLGIEAQDLTPQLASYFGVKQGKGVLVAEVEAGSPAAKAGLKAGDCIVRVDTTEVDSISSLRRALAQRNGADHGVSLSIVRKAHEESLHVDLQPAWTPNPEQEAENFNGSVERQVRQLETQIPRIERREKQLESCLVALENHIFELQMDPVHRTAMVSGPHAGWLASGAGCSWKQSGNGS